MCKKRSSRYLDDILNIHNVYFDNMVSQIYPAGLQHSASFVGPFVICVSCLSVILSCLFLSTFLGRAGKGLALDLLYVVFSCVYGVLGQVWYLIVSILDLCLLRYFITIQIHFIRLKDWSFIIHNLFERHVMVLYCCQKCRRCIK